jgi:hypothetical protein
LLKNAESNAEVATFPVMCLWFYSYISLMSSWISYTMLCKFCLLID